ncbi:methyl-accepting chemotaxis protein [Rhizobium glycinendophyticum]|uniref:Methyl-accepting chemotaxis protein n=2 Tax=Rhizobium glycinendophyticum TaxID=2589807 RepID=A0A504UBD7_9HYPH|nr:methyl-accepting chemotaxis protein [Rhizobium glycinendophyticum]
MTWQLAVVKENDMNELQNLRAKASVGLQTLLWINFALIVLSNSLRAEGVDWFAIGATLLMLAPVTLVWLKDRTGQATRIMTSMALAMTVSILVYSFSGSPLQIDMHMYFFATLAVCAAWIDWRAIVAFAGFVAVHHLAVYFVMPLAVFPGESDFSRVILHAVVLILQSGVLIALTFAVVRAFEASDKAVETANVARQEASAMADLARQADATAADERLHHEAEKAKEAEAVQFAVSELGAVLSRLADGDLSCRIAKPFPGKLDELRSSFNTSVENLEAVVGQVGEVAKVIRLGTSQIADANQDLSSRSERQAASIEETASALSGVATTVRQTAQVADSVGRMVDQARNGAERSGSIVTDAVSAMSRIENSSREISQIIGVIDEIAFQTNLLALNAGVEAARAGEAGKGFAVVAQEVRELAQRSANAAKEIKTLINASGEQVRHGVSLVDQAGEALSTIAQEVNSISEQVAKIVATTREQSAGLSEIDAAIGHIDRNTQQNAAMVEESTAAIQQLVHETGTLESLMARFSLQRGGPTARRAA